MNNHESHNRPEAFAPKTGMTVETTPNRKRTNVYLRNDNGTAFRITLFWGASVFSRMYRCGKPAAPGFQHWNSIGSFKTFEELLKKIALPVAWTPEQKTQHDTLVAVLTDAVNGFRQTRPFSVVGTADNFDVAKAIEAAKEPTPEAVEAPAPVASKPEPKPEPKPFEYLGEEISKPAIRIKELRDQVNSFKGRITEFQKAGWMVQDNDEHNAQREQFRFCQLVDELHAELESIRQNVAGI